MLPRPAVFKWRHFAPEVILCAVRLVSSILPLPIATSRNCWSNAAWRSAIRRPGDGFSAAHWSWGANSTTPEKQPTNPGGWMKPMFALGFWPRRLNSQSCPADSRRCLSIFNLCNTSLRTNAAGNHLVDLTVNNPLQSRCIELGLEDYAYENS